MAGATRDATGRSDAESSRSPRPTSGDTHLNSRVVWVSDRALARFKRHRSRVPLVPDRVEAAVERTSSGRTELAHDQAGAEHPSPLRIAGASPESPAKPSDVMSKFGAASRTACRGSRRNPRCTPWLVASFPLPRIAGAAYSGTVCLPCQSRIPIATLKRMSRCANSAMLSPGLWGTDRHPEWAC